VADLQEAGGGGGVEEKGGAVDAAVLDEQLDNGIEIAQRQEHAQCQGLRRVVGKDHGQAKQKTQGEKVKMNSVPWHTQLRH